MYSIYHLNMNTEKPLFAAVRVRRISSLQHLNACAIHGRRKDPSAIKRCDKSRTGQNIATSDYSTDPLDLIGAFKERKRQSGAKEYGKSPLGLHALCIVSPEVIRAGGDLHDPENPLNQQLSAEAKAWAEAEFGAGSVIATRLDVDESSGGVVDLFIVPVRNMTMRGKSKPIISVNKALAEIAERHERRKSYMALQDSWADHARVLNPEIQRGEERGADSPDYEPPEQFAARKENERQAEQNARHEQEIREKQRSLVKTERLLNEGALKLAQEQRVFEEKRLFIAQIWDVLQREVRKLDKKLRDELAEDRKKGRKWGSFLRSLVGQDEKKKIGLAIDKGREEGRLERQSDVDAANRKAERAIKDRDRAREDLKHERDDRAKDFVLPKREQAEYAIWKSQQLTKTVAGRSNDLARSGPIGP